MKINIKKFIAISALISTLPAFSSADDGRITVARAFYELARRNDVQKIEMLLDKGYSIESIDERGYNPVCLAVIKQDRSAYKSLTSYGAQQRPSCLQKIPEAAYKRFFGTAPVKTAAMAMTYTSDVPYIVGATALGIGAVATAYALRGSLDSGSGGGGGDKKKCKNGVYDEDTHKCICNEGYGNYGDDKTCYPTVNDCETQVKENCLECDDTYYLKNNVCYAQIVNCKEQDGDTCLECNDNYILKDNVCYAPIKNCKIQDGDICKECNSGYGVHGGDGKRCYTNIENCKVQLETSCQQCISGYGTYGDPSTCYKSIDHCMVQVQTACSQCAAGYDTYGNPAADYCYSENPCAAWNHTIPIRNSGTVTCVCNENKGYFGEKENCQKAEEGEAHEGDGNTEEWNNLNAQYCHSHGKYNVSSGLCTCYTGYAGPSNGCVGCAEGYTNFGNEGGLCYKELNCGEKKHQVGNNCVCDEEYYSYEGECYTPLQCQLHYTQTDPTTCSCKDNFNDDCTDCKQGYSYDATADECVREAYICTENWTGSDCDICPAQFKITTQSGEKHCLECADNRLSKEAGNDDECSLCAPGYDKDELSNSCIITECSAGTPGYIKDETTGKCVCDEANGYARSLLGACVLKGEDIIGVENSNINNNTIELHMDGSDGRFNDVYGMRPVIKDEEGNKTYYDEVYNAYADADKGDQTGIINITNRNVGGNEVYGIYSPNTIYNAAVYGSDETGSATATGIINIKDENTISNVFGMVNRNPVSIYNAFAGNAADASAVEPSNNTAIASIRITKDEDSTKEKENNGSGAITGIKGVGNILNAFTNTVNGTAANVYATGSIELLHNGIGQVIGIYGLGANQKVNNALSYLDSVISDSVAIGNINVSGNGDVYGIFSSGTVVNSETQFSKAFPVLRDFRAEGTINALGKTDEGTAYGINVFQGGGDTHADIYNAYGYNSRGDINVTNVGGGSAYGIWNPIKTYHGEDEEGHMVTLYNNTYNAFRSSAKYGGQDSTTKGNINVTISGVSNALRNATGIYASGDVFNSYAKSLSDVDLRTVGNITINDTSKTPGMTLKGIESGGGTIANAYGIGSNLNTTTSVLGNITVNVSGAKLGSAGEASGIYSDEPVTQTAKIYNAALINDKSNVEGNIKVSGTGSTTFSRMYGIYASRYQVNSGSDEGQEKEVYNAYYDNEESWEGTVKGTISVKTTSRSMSNSGEYYGIFINGGKAYNAYTTNPAANVIGSITVSVEGGENEGMAVGMYGNSAMLYNTGKSTIDVSSARQNNHAYGMKAGGDNSYIENDATINVTSKAAKAYGLYIENGQAINKQNGVITVSGKKGSYGIYAVDDGLGSEERKIINQGTIRLTSEENNIGIYGDGANVKVYNEESGKIYINGTKATSVCEGTDCTNSAIQLVNGAQFINGGEVNSGTEVLNLSSTGGNIILTTKGKFKTLSSITGNLNVDSSTVKDNFDDETRLEGAITAADVSALNLKSNSFLYNPTLRSNSNGSYDVVLERKDFSVLTKDKDDAKYLDKNYRSERNMALFNTLKGISSASEAEKTWADVSGKSVLPNIPEEELKVQRSLDRTMMDGLFKEGDDIRRMVGGDAMHIGRDTHNTLTGYDLDSQSMYALYDQKQNNNYRLGLGLSFTHTNTDYNNDSRRKNFMVQGYVPLSYTNRKGLTAVSMARLGYANGDYKRYGYNKATYEADTEAITYGLLNEARYTYDLKFLKLTPFIGLNATGWYQNSTNEGNEDLALHIASSNVFSLESALGIYLDKEIEFDQDQRLNIALGMGYYHEFADPYKGAEARHTGSISHHHLKNTMHSRDRGVLSAKINYDYKNLSVYGELIQYLEEENPIEIEGGLKYKF